MALIEKLEKNTELKSVYMEIPLSHRYTLGVGAEKFFRALKDDGEILAGKCPECEEWFLPPAIFCEQCFARMEEWKDVGLTGLVTSFTVAHFDLEGKKLPIPQVYALIGWPGVEGGLIHKLGEVKPEEVFIGMKVKARLVGKKDRKGLITDILYFAPEK